MHLLLLLTTAVKHQYNEPSQNKVPSIMSDIVHPNNAACKESSVR